MTIIDKRARQILSAGGKVSAAANLDRNTLNTLHLLLVERSVTRTALLLGQSQPSVSETLARLRKLVGDPLLVRSGSRMVLTDHARELLAPVQRALADLEQIAATRSAFDARRTHRTFRLATADNVGGDFHAALAARLRAEAPNARLEAWGLIQGYDYERSLGEGKVDVVVANWPEPPLHLHMGALFESGLACMMSRGHRASKKPMTWNLYSTLAHVDITPRSLGEVSPVDFLLLKLGIQRDVRVNYPYFSLIPAIVARSDLVFTATRQFLRQFEASLPVVIKRFPQDLPPVRFYQLWHERTHSSDECRWFRALVKSAAQSAREAPAGR